MPKYKVSVSKDQKKYSIILNAQDETQLKEKVHKEWYSILGIETITEDIDIKWHKFYFTGEIGWNIKNGSIIGEDIFKVYVKLRKSLGYNVLQLFPEKDKNTDPAEKDKILRDLSEQYKLFLLERKDDPKELKQQEFEENISSFYMKKRLDKTYELIELVLAKIENAMVSPQYNLNDEQKHKLQKVHDGIVKLKKSTNISKLNEVGELALLKLWKIELQKVEDEKDNESKKLLKETNKLLKKIGSPTQYVEKSKDIKYILSSFLDTLSEKFWKNDNKEELLNLELDKNTYSYRKTENLLLKYRQKKKENTKEIVSNIWIFVFPFSEKARDKRDTILIKRKVIGQNISLLKAKISGKWFSYTKVKKSYLKTIKFIINFIKEIKNYIFYVWVIYGISFIIFLNLSWAVKMSMNYDGIFYFILIALLYILLSFTRGLITLTLNFVFLYFIVIFWIINF